jgi:hypothetical protein
MCYKPVLTQITFYNCFLFFTLIRTRKTQNNKNKMKERTNIDLKKKNKDRQREIDAKQLDNENKKDIT